LIGESLESNVRMKKGKGKQSSRNRKRNTCSALQVNDEDMKRIAEQRPKKIPTPSLPESKESHKDGREKIK
jgi:hypothetical protein